MDTSMIRKLFKNYKCFKGVFPCDQLPYNLSLPLNIIVNTDPSYLPGEHWVCISINKNGFGQYFDSFGLYPIKEEIFKFLEEKCYNGWSYNQVTLQNINSNTCGNYCVLYIIYMCENLTNEDFISRFNENTIENDEKMRRIFKNFSLVRKF